MSADNTEDYDHKELELAMKDTRSKEPIKVNVTSTSSEKVLLSTEEYLHNMNNTLLLILKQLEMITGEVD